MRRRAVVAAVLAGLVAGLWPGSPARADTFVAAAPGGFATNYLTPIAFVRPGEPLIFVNADLAPHDVVALEDFRTDAAPWCIGREDRCPLFWSELVDLGGVTPVLGVDDLEPGATYAFYCTLHPNNMIGTLVVLPA